MPNWVTNKISAPEHVIRSMLNAEGHIDFNTAAPFPGPNNDWDSISCAAEEAAEIVCGIPVSGHPLVGMLQTSNREKFDIKKLPDDCFRQFVGMLENYRACGYLHGMDFARKVWGTKWNACRPTASPEEGRCEFETAWSCPTGVLTKLSERFPDDEISVTYADEDIGSNCGTFTLKNGQIVVSDIAPSWSAMSANEKEKWKSFAYEVKGINPKDYEDEDESKAA